MLHKWLFSGELYDPFAEFFVAVNPELAHLQYVQQASDGQLAGDGGFTGVGAEGDDILDEREGGLKLWEGKYQFQKDMLPAFVGEAFGRKVMPFMHNGLTGSNRSHLQIFSTGKSLNFIRYNCHDSDWVVTQEKMSNTGGCQFSLFTSHGRVLTPMKL